MYIVIEETGDIRMGREEVMSPEDMRRALGGPPCVETGPVRSGRSMAVATDADAKGKDRPCNLLATLAAHRFGIVPEDVLLSGTAVFAAARDDTLLPLSADESAAFGIVLGIARARTAEGAV